MGEDRPGAEGTGQEGGMGNAILGPQIHSHSLTTDTHTHTIIHNHTYTPHTTIYNATHPCITPTLHSWTPVTALLPARM